MNYVIQESGSFNSFLTQASTISSEMSVRMPGHDAAMIFQLRISVSTLLIKGHALHIRGFTG